MGRIVWAEEHPINRRVAPISGGHLWFRTASYISLNSSESPKRNTRSVAFFVLCRWRRRWCRQRHRQQQRWRHRQQGRQWWRRRRQRRWLRSNDTDINTSKNTINTMDDIINIDDHNVAVPPSFHWQAGKREPHFRLILEQLGLYFSNREPGEKIRHRLLGFEAASLEACKRRSTTEPPSLACLSYLGCLRFVKATI